MTRAVALAVALALAALPACGNYGAPVRPHPADAKPGPSAPNDQRATDPNTPDEAHPP